MLEIGLRAAVPGGLGRGRTARMAVHPLAGKPAPRDLLVNVPRLVAAYYTRRPDVNDPAERVVFGTSGHRGSSLARSRNGAYIAATCQAIDVQRQSRGGP